MDQAGTNMEEKTNRQDGGFRIHTYSSKELAASYGCSQKTLTRWINRFGKEVGPRMGHLYNPRQVRIIVEKLGMPG